MAARRKTYDGVKLPSPVEENGYPDGDGPAWISEALGAPGCLDGVARHLSDDGEETALVLRFANGREQIIRPARLVTTRRLTETLGALGFPLPYYSPPQLAKLGQAIGRVADRDLTQLQERSHEVIASVVASWLAACAKAHTAYVVAGRAGVDVRAAIEHVRCGVVGGDPRVPLIVEPGRTVETPGGGLVEGALLAWRAPAAMAVRDRLGTKSDGTIGLALTESGLRRERLAARAAGGERSPHELPVWVVYNGWQGVEVVMPDGARESGQVQLCLL